MIQKQTVLILGAGASMDFRFPSGLGLTARVCERLQNDNEVTRGLHECGFDLHKCRDFSNTLRQSGALSVDAFLGARTDLIDVGKLAIAAALIPFEQPAAIHTGNAQASWLQILFQRMSAPRAQWQRNNLSIITFNYDRVMEHFFHVSLMHHFGLSHEEAEELRRNTAAIVHVHGLLGDFEYEPTGGGRPFVPDLTAASLRKAANKIRIIHEGDTGDAEFVHARALLETAEEVVILGFGYGETNMKRLGFPASLDAKAVYGSSIGMTDTERAMAERIGFRSAHILHRSDDSLTMFLRQNPVLGHG